MARPTDWSALDLPGDPVPGDTAVIRSDARALKQVAALITEQAQRLKTVAAKGEDAWDSEAGKAFVRNSSDLAGEIDKAKGRYEQTGAALAAYADDLDGVQASADQLLRHAQDAKADQHRAQSMTLPDASDPSYQTASHTQKTRLDAANSSLRSTQDGLAQVLDDWTRINHKAASAISSASDDDLKDHWWQSGVFGAVTGAVHWISHLDNLKKVLGWVGMALAATVLVALIFFPGTTFLALALIASFAVAAANFAITAKQFSDGDESGADLAWAGVDLALSAFGAAAGLKIMGSAAEAGSQLSRTAGSAAKGLQRGSTFWQRASSSRTVSMMNDWTDKLEAPIASAVRKIKSSSALAKGNELRGLGMTRSDALKSGWSAVHSRTESLLSHTVDALDENMTGGIGGAFVAGSAGSGRTLSILGSTLFSDGRTAALASANVGKAAIDGYLKFHSIGETVTSVHETISGGGTETVPNGMVVSGGW